ncbi:uncharacterized protein TRUGW13939_09828 [Talaromyces rugulosus]|uniref:Transcription factor domain-containing protein n=1 Tax=Talaromyces rugulosus TaxID=121627 RepID=A0A7H8R977_TALRU|nr:uncharacterized protein TRUGW13939_09828 [Talaromyces rugulosus]QKX62667.1 hypothetical protein TRUGW13939_09828 [Talaromyces rugulosus]
MVIIGSCLSPEKSDNKIAAAWFNAVEEMVFDDEWLEENYTASSWIQNPGADMKRLRSLQAAYFVCLFQNWEGSESSKQRIRRHRYNTLIAIVRSLQPASVTHMNTLRAVNNQLFEWESFINTEEKIRTLSYVFLLDGGFVIFNNMPPRMVVSELEMGLACPDECFQAPSASECLAILETWAGKTPQFYQYSIVSVLETMFRRDLSVEKKGIYAHFGILNLFIIVTALHTLVFQLQNAMAPPEAFQRIENALRSWKDVWVYRKVVLCYSDDIEDADSSFQMWKRVGFMRDACEFWLLCCVILERIRPNEHDDSTSSVPGRALTKYDQTDMKQVNDLMKQFETVSLTD